MTKTLETPFLVVANPPCGMVERFEKEGRKTLSGVGGYTFSDGEMIEEDCLMVFCPEAGLDVYRLDEFAKTVLRNSPTEESVLLVDARREGCLLFRDGRLEYVGHWTEIPFDTRRQFPGWTFVNGRTFTCKR